ncbi:pantoate--beta-alanine ligase [Zobellia uliginosa]|uniref:pantoate--beta-alanine ligase n=1 Tax=Zobellia uliginosa TaxID=143224 RepID=UPI001C06F734|nr:pantoate--beta-alanine ligase [Zobellia uliginosa]MBU2948547.1 pantoate--beta-alanine ligase [Zobellia uliginosa]
MLVFRTKKELSNYISSLSKNENLGLVPTMGALHTGHASLVEKAVSENNTVVVSIFVNPTQFDNKEDLAKYPNTLDADLDLLSNVSEGIVVFSPSADEVYDHKIEAKKYDFEGLDTVMEGAYRDDHFNGVGTIVEALLTLVKPNRAYFGEKDFQQLQIIRKLVEQQHIPVEIIGCPIVRETSGLAMSSRNERLSKELRQKASFIYSTLLAAKEKFGTESANYVLNWVKNQFKEHVDLELEYIEITDVETLSPVTRKNENLKYRAFIAVYAGGVRLIDNIAL